MPATLAPPQPSGPTVTAALGATRTSHRWNEMPGNWDRLNTRMIFASSNPWGIPDLPTAGGLVEPARLVAYNDRRGCENAGPGSCVHFFLDDYRFETVWTKPERPLTRLQRVGTALTPDFSLWRDMPLAMQLWQVYRARWCGAWMAAHGLHIIPTISWSTPDTFDFAFAGIAPESLVAVSTVGVRDRDAQALFAAGYTAMLTALDPVCVLIYGTPPPEDLTAGTPVHVYPSRWAGR
ncbi:DUF4417 domain-containing protein [Hamadaea sp. NPDC051192]|uniref:DUF4417 domain-containing protein n=1 Tax=Hamadaea sp. NPDC051192 TaxID=3154940 RepID=UPI00342F208D